MLVILTYLKYVPVPALRPPSLTAARYEKLPTSERAPRSIAGLDPPYMAAAQ
jgi:hypothetical protein